MKSSTCENKILNESSCLGLINWPFIKYVFFYLLFLVFSPVTIVLGILLVLYRKIIQCYIKCLYGSKFKGFLDGTDVLFTLDDTSNMVLNMFAHIEIPKREYEKDETGCKLLKKMREKFDLDLLELRKCPKFLYKRNLRCGFSFWTEEPPGHINKYVRKLENNSETEFITAENLRETLGDISNMPLPDGNSRAWEFLVGVKGIDKGDVINFPVSFF